MRKISSDAGMPFKRDPTFVRYMQGQFLHYFPRLLRLLSLYDEALFPFYLFRGGERGELVPSACHRLCWPATDNGGPPRENARLW